MKLEKVALKIFVFAFLFTVFFTVSTAAVQAACGDGVIDGVEVCDIAAPTSCAIGETCEAGCGNCIKGLIWNRRLVKDRVEDLIEFILSITGSVALLALIISGILYIVSGGNSDLQVKAKKMLMFSIEGIVVILLSYAILAVIDNLLVR
ncbi:MAG: hypothetical protein PHI66_00600 [Candidatus Pacebacteria bacterium]|nr:hypothetical protein [Candidatus Paceibacterota bacterium]